MSTSITLNKISKRYDYQWIVKDFSYSFDNKVVTGLTGSNGSGKSTLIKIISGYLSSSSGSITHLLDQASKPVHADSLYKYISLVAPYTDVILEYNLRELYDFHRYFKPLVGVDDYKSFSEVLQLPAIGNKTIQQCSSGMKQKIQLGLALMSDTPFLLLDEPTSFLDTNAKQWFVDMLAMHRRDRCIIIASNDGFDLELCGDTVDVNGRHS